MMHIAFLSAYFLGSIPFGLVLAQIFDLGDLRKIGSGNIGATNVLRTGHIKIAAATLLLDGLKGALAVWLTTAIAPGYEAYSALIAVLGHVWSVWLGFKGGKGVATAFGVTLALMPLVGVCAGALWIGVFYITRISSLSALVALGASPLLATVLAEPPLDIFAALLALLIFHTHHANIRRLINGEEPRFGSSRT